MNGTRRRSADLGPKKPARSLLLSLQSGAGAHALPATRAQLRRWVLAALECDAELTLRFVGRTEAVALNRAFRSKAYAPDVLTFVYPGEGSPMAPLGSAARFAASTAAPVRLHADIVLCMPVLRAQARASGIALEQRLAHLVIHGVLHAQGWDHETHDQAQVMQERETALLRRFRIPDPWA